MADNSVKYTYLLPVSLIKFQNNQSEKKEQFNIKSDIEENCMQYSKTRK
jgi:hypothetical protein